MMNVVLMKGSSPKAQRPVLKSPETTSIRPHPVESDDQFVAVVLVLISAGFDGEAEVWVSDSRQEEVDHGP